MVSPDQTGYRAGAALPGSVAMRPKTNRMHQQIVLAIRAELPDAKRDRIELATISIMRIVRAYYGGRLPDE
jgi:hypothetical protein